MKNLCSIIAIHIVLFNSGCEPIPQPSPLQPTPMRKEYTLNVKVSDNQGQPIQNAKIIVEELKRNNFSKTGIIHTIETDSLGLVEIVVPFKVERMTTTDYTKLLSANIALLSLELGKEAGKPDIVYSSRMNTVYYYLADVTVQKEGYYSQYFKALSVTEKDNLRSFSNKSKDVMLTKPKDFFDQEYYLQSKSFLKEKILAFIDVIRIEGWLRDSKLSIFSIKEISFKDHNYLRLGFENLVTYNSLKLNKYDIGKKVFDELIRKILSPFNDYIYSPDEFWGYDLNVTGRTKDFTKKESKPTLIEYRFLIPAEVVKQYKNLDISGQDVLDNSIILMDNERIKLQLQ